MSARRIRLCMLLAAACLTGSCAAGSGPSPHRSGEPAASGSPVAGGRQLVSFHGVQVEVPAGWPVVDGMHTGLCGSPFPTAGWSCASCAHHRVIMPPRRLAARLVLDHGDVTLNRPLASDRPATPAVSAWRASGHGSPFERYRLILARYSAKFPARQNADGSLTPEDHRVLAWIVYGRPRTAISGCGGWSLDAYDALTGQGIVSSGWSPGP